MHDDVAAGFLAGCGTMGAFMRAYDWTGSALGVPAAWSQSLRTAVRLLLNTEHPMLLLWGPRLICIYNEAFCRLLGPDRHPGAFAADARAVFDDLWPVFGPRIEHVLAGRGSTWDEAQALGVVRGEAPAHWTYSLSPIDDEQTAGGIAGVLLICTDVSRVHAAHANLHVEHARLLELFRQAPGFIAASRGRDHVIEMANDAYRALVGSERPLVGRPVREALPELAGQGFFELLDEVYRSGEAHIGEVQPIALARSAGSAPETRYISYVYAPVRAADGSVDGIITEGQDVTALKNAEFALRRALEANAAILAHTRDLICVLDAEGHILEVSASAMAVLGHAPDSVRGRHFCEFVDAADATSTVAAFTAVVAGHSTSTFENRQRHADGRTVSIQWSAVWVPEQACVIAIGRDLSERLATERALRQARDIELIGRLAGGVAHDFNNLLTVILGNSELLAQTLAADDALRELAQITVTAAERGAELTRRLLAIGRQQNLSPSAVDIARCLRAARDFLARVLPANITLDIEVQGDDFIAWVDAQQFEHAVLNLCVNARDAMPGGGRIDIAVSHAQIDADDTTTSNLRAGRYVRVRVRDSGPGMDAATAARAFEPFFSTKPSARGSGLGLATVQGFAEQSGGRATLDSAPGRGTTITLYLPIPRID